ncbi:histidine kinase [Paraflavitalea soli]|uniref:Histidine kinase n=1 Tax=Paraflavitalea soli TaxID=2315862 RepID=A0A3B7MLP8_9BACT|nr:histidine kinase [Paraflavitalea soli]AXY73886.1 histidine kinase [Paraflavitalea soli]
MKQLLIVCILLCLLLPTVIAQINFKEAGAGTQHIAWENYSTTYLGEGSDSIPLIVTAIPYNGIYEYGDQYSRNTPMDMSFSGYRFRSQLANGRQQLYTYDSSEVYFLTPGIYQHNAAQYEFRVLEDDQKLIRDWGPVTAFFDASFQLNVFHVKFGFLGGFTTSWGHFLVVELRKKGAAAPFTASVVYWQSTRPALEAVFTTRDLTTIMLNITNDYRLSKNFTRELWKNYPPDQLDSVTGLPKHLEVASGQNGLIFQVGARIYKKGTLEYRVMRNGHVHTDWTGNKANNSYVWIDDPGPGNYTLEMRYRKQRHHVTSFSFTVQPAWYETWAFRLITGILIIAFIGFVVLLFKLRRQRKKTAAEQAKKERFEQGLKSVYAQLNPHFTFNALSSIQGLINNNDIKGANRYLSDFASLVRHSLTDSERASIPLQRELQTLDTYLTLEKMRFNFTYIIHCEEALPAAETEIPSLLLQPLAENAVKHGVATLQEKGLIRVEVLRQQDDMVIRISDNGLGFEPGRETTGYGLKLTKDRIRLLNEMAEKEQIQLNITSEAQQGTVVELLFKNWLV